MKLVSLKDGKWGYHLLYQLQINLQLSILTLVKQNSVCKIYLLKITLHIKNKHVILHCTVKIKTMTFIMRQKENVYKKMQEKEQTQILPFCFLENTLH